MTANPLEGQIYNQGHSKRRVPILVQGCRWFQHSCCSPGWLQQCSSAY